MHRSICNECDVMMLEKSQLYADDQFVKTNFDITNTILLLTDYCYRVLH